MNTYAEDKENYNPRSNVHNIPSKSNFGKARGFNALLESATKEKEHDLNFSVAVKTQCQDINQLVDKLVEDFRQEDKDSKYARQLHESDLANEKMLAEQKSRRENKDEHTAKELYMQEIEEQKERARQRQSAEHKDESTALSVAMQERRDVQKRAQSKREMEAKDCDFAKQTVLDDLNSHQEMEAKCINDEKVALALKQQLEDELYAEELQDKVEREARAEASRIAAQDQVLAQEIECNLRKHAVENAKEQEAKDKLLATKLLTQSARQAYEEEFSKKTRRKTEDFSMSAIAAQWENADVDFDDVPGGICITLLLPHLADLKVTVPKSHLISIEARRMAMTGDKHVNKNNSFYAAEFEIRGKNVKLAKSDINYNYASETGLLHIYVENVSLSGMVGEESTSLMSSMKSSFARMFS